MKRVQDALSSTSLPAFAGAWRATAQNPTAPEQYLVYTSTRVEAEHWDDTLKRYLVYMYLNLWSRDDPTAAASLIRAAMREGGFAMIEERTEYDAETGDNLVIWTWVCDEGGDT